MKLKQLFLLAILLLSGNISGFAVDRDFACIKESETINIPDSLTSVKINSALRTPNINLHKKEIKAPGKIPSFWWSFVISFVGGATLWGLGAGPLSVLIVYFSSGKNKKEVRKSVWGWIAGSILGVLLWIVAKSI